MSCLACGNQQHEHLYDGILSCPACKFSRADLNLSEEAAKKIYGKNYFFGDEYVDYLNEEAALRENARRNLKWMASFCPGGKLLEIGCAYGFFLDEAKHYYDVNGVDIHEEGCKHARRAFNLKARAGNFLDMPCPENSFDAIASWNTLEHLARPDLFIQKSSRLLKKDGALFFSTLDITSFPAKIRGKHWRQIHPPTHISYFSWKSLCIMLENAGFSITDKKYRGEYRSWDNTFFILFVLRSKNKKLYESLKKRNWLKGIYYLNTFDIITCAAKKR